MCEKSAGEKFVGSNLETPMQPTYTKKYVYFLTNQPKTFTSVPACYPGRSSMLGHCIERPSMLLLFTTDLITLTCPFKDSKEK